jgi:NAD(P)-dependent dehydrogenase (short-subunit alcohol dehydrogenase family)
MQTHLSCAIVCHAAQRAIAAANALGTEDNVGELDGVSVIVTGGTKGIGAGIVRVLASEGARIAITARDGARARKVADHIASDGGVAIGLAHDVANASSCAEVVRHTVGALGRIDVLVNNAGISERIPFRDIDDRSWDRMLNVNLKGAYLMTKAVIADMLPRRAGHIINVASLLSKTGGPLFSHYTASKFGLIGLTQSLAAELAPHRILVNAICPGVIRTPLWGPELRGVANDTGISIEEAWDAAVTEVPLGRPQRGEDIGYVVAYLAGAAGRNITGESINVNGGQLMD